MSANTQPENRVLDFRYPERTRARGRDETSEDIARCITIDLRNAALCAEDHLFNREQGRTTCPSCGSGEWVLLSSFLRPLDAAEETICEADVEFDSQGVS